MGIFSRLFGGTGQNDRSYVRTWSKKQERESHYSNEITVDNLFGSIMYALSTFGDKRTKKHATSDMRGLGLDVSEYYSGDAALFELGCYLYFRLDLWLFKNKPYRREGIMSAFADRFIRLFTEALNNQDVPTLFNQRCSQYAKLIRTGTDMEKLHFHLSQLIIRTRDNQLPTSYDFKNEPVSIIGATEQWGMNMELLSWEQFMIPTLIENLKKYCVLTE